MASLSGGLTTQESAYDYSSSTLPLKTLNIVEPPKLRENRTTEIQDDSFFHKRSTKDIESEFSISQIPNENISVNNNKSQRFNSKTQTIKISSEQEITIYDTSRIIREFEKDKSLKKSLAARAISQSKFSTNDIKNLNDWNNLSPERKRIISNEIYNLTVSGTNINLQLVASYIIWSKTNV